MAKTVKETAKQSGRNPKTRKISRETEKVRRRYDTQIAQRIREVFGEKVKSRQVQKYLKEHSEMLKDKTISELQDVRLGLQYNREEKKYDIKYKKASDVLDGYTNIRNTKRELEIDTEVDIKKDSSANVYRRNELFKEQMRQAKRKLGLSDLNSEDIDTFYRATRHLWKKQSNVERRNDEIIKAFGISDLEQIFNLIIKKELKAKDFGFDDVKLFEDWIENLNKTVKLDKIREIIKEEIKILNDNKVTGGNTNDSAYNGPEVTHKDGSPQYAQNIVTRIAELFADG